MFGGTLFLLHVTSCFVTVIVVIMDTKKCEESKFAAQKFAMLLFGSLARDEQHEGSDVDICVDMVPNLFNQAGVKIYLQELLGCNVDVVRMRERMNPVFKQQILKYGIRVY